MINLLLGAPGGGKSYEAVVFHVLTAVQDGRKVITNLPIFVDQIAAIEPRARQLIEHRTVHRSGQGRPFSTVDEYGDAWRHPDSGGGALYVIDEAHTVLPREGTPREVREWYAEHRHEGCDVLLVTQSYGKLDADIRDLVQLVYRVRKKVAWGQPDRYIRKVQDGIRGEVMAVAERQYEARYFRLYRSHTKSLGAVNEFGAMDVSPRYRKFIYAGVAVLAVAVGAAAWQLMREKAPARQSVQRKPVVVQPPGVVQSAPVVEGAAPRVAAGPVVSPAVTTTTRHPFAGLTMHLAGAVHAGGRYEYLVMTALNGQVTATYRAADLREAGYEVEWVSECVARVSYPDVPDPWFVRCDVPQAGGASPRRLQS